MRRRDLLKDNGIKYQFVDMGLPSGILWAKGLLCKDSQGNYYIGKETERGTYVSWGNIDGHNRGEGYNFDETTYNSTSGASKKSSISPGDTTYDICSARLGVQYHLPTRSNFVELVDNTDSEKTTIDGVDGYKFMKKTDHSVYIFIRFCGYYNGTSLVSSSTRTDLWSSIRNTSTSQSMFLGANTGIDASNTLKMYYGILVRAVCNP